MQSVSNKAPLRLTFLFIYFDSVLRNASFHLHWFAFRIKLGSSDPSTPLPLFIIPGEQRDSATRCWPSPSLFWGSSTDLYGIYGLIIRSDYTESSFMSLYNLDILIVLIYIIIKICKIFYLLMYIYRYFYCTFLLHTILYFIKF